MTGELGQPIESERRHGRNWVQTERAAHQAWDQLIAHAPMAARLAHVLVANMGEGNAVVASQKALGELLGRANLNGKPVHRNTVRKAIQRLEADRWIEIVEIGGKGGALGYRINSRVAWHGKRDSLRYARFSAEVLASESEQSKSLDDRPPLRRVPTIMRGETALPSGPPDEPPSQGLLGGMEPSVEAGENEHTIREELERHGQQRIDYQGGQ